MSRNSHCLDLIYCAGDNERLTRIAHEAGFLIGIRSGRTAHGFPVKFVDIEYRKPNFHKHLLSVRRHWPKYATVLDLSEEEVSEQDIARALSQYEELSYSCEVPLIVPKLSGQIALLPSHVAIGYSGYSAYRVEKHYNTHTPKPGISCRSGSVKVSRLRVEHLECHHPTINQAREPRKTAFLKDPI